MPNCWAASFRRSLPSSRRICTRCSALSTDSSEYVGLRFCGVFHGGSLRTVLVVGSPIHASRWRDAPE